MSSQTSPKRLGKYELREKLGHGGAAEVWKAFDTELHRYVAIKLLHADLQTDPEFIQRFSREARFIAALRHPNIVQIHDLQSTQPLEVDAPVAYMVMDYVEGKTLAHYIRMTSRVGKFPAPADIVRLFTSISKAVDYAHQQGMIHRDIKPANILLDKRHTGDNSIGEPILTDFGIAKIVGISSGTASGMWLGTPLYISPEQAQGYTGTERSDIYSLGVILYEICTGVCPFSSESATAIMMQQISLAPTPPALINPAIPPPLTAVILRAMAKDPAERFSSASALTAAIAEAFNLPVPAGLFWPVQPQDDPMGPTQLSPRRSGSFPSVIPLGAQGSQSPSALASVLQIPPPVPASQQLTAPGASGDELPITLTGSDPVPLSPPPVMRTMSNISPLVSPPPAMRTMSDISPPAVSKVAAPPATRRRRGWSSVLLVLLVILLVLGSSTLVAINLLSSAHASPPTLGTMTFTNSGQYDAKTTVGYNDIVTISLRNVAAPKAGMAYFAWLLPDPENDATVPLLLGRLVVNGGNSTLRYVSPQHTNLLAQYSVVRVTEESTDYDPSIPSPDTKTWRWEGGISSIPTPGDKLKFSLLSHFRHLLAKESTLQANQLSGGLVIWMTRNVAKVDEWSSAAQGSWGDGDADLVHRHLLRILDYLDGQTYVWRDVPAGSEWLVDPRAGKLGLLSYNQGQWPPGFLQHVDIHLTLMLTAPGHTEEQKKVAIEVDNVITRMINDLQKVRKDAMQLVQLSNDQLLGPDALTMLNEMKNLTTEVNSGWFDPATGQNRGGVVWVSARIQQLVTISLTASNQQ